MICVGLAKKNPDDLLRSLADLDTKTTMAEIHFEDCGFHSEELLYFASNLGGNYFGKIVFSYAVYDDEGMEKQAKCFELLSRYVQTNHDVYLQFDYDMPQTRIDQYLAICKRSRWISVMCYNNDEQTPSYNDLVEIITLSLLKGANIVNLSTKVHDNQDLTNILGLYNPYSQWQRLYDARDTRSHSELSHTTNNQGRLVVSTTGYKAQLLQVVAPSFGAPFTYASINQEQSRQTDLLPRKDMIYIEEIMNRARAVHGGR